MSGPGPFWDPTVIWLCTGSCASEPFCCLSHIRNPSLRHKLTDIALPLWLQPSAPKQSSMFDPAWDPHHRAGSSLCLLLGDTWKFEANPHQKYVPHYLLVSLPCYLSTHFKKKCLLQSGERWWALPAESWMTFQWVLYTIPKHTHTHTVFFLR